MRLVSIDTALFDKYQGDPEVLTKSKRPYVLVIRLKYKEKNYDFAVPIRSNIPAAAPKSQYFALPPRPTTRPKNRHGLHYIKMFPVTKQYLIRYRTEGNKFATLIQDIIDKNTKTIVTDCQNYLDLYAEGHHPLFSTDIDYLLSQLFPEKTVIQSGIPEVGESNHENIDVKTIDSEISADINEVESTSAIVRTAICTGQQPTEAQIQEIEAAASVPVVTDEDAPELTHEQYTEMAALAKKRRNKETKP